MSRGAARERGINLQSTGPCKLDSVGCCAGDRESAFFPTMEVPSNTPIQPAHMRTVIDILTNEPSNLEKLGAAFHDFNKLNSGT